MKRRICWPDFDEVCLQGGCLYCNDSKFVDVEVILRKVRESADEGMLNSFRYGEAHRWHNADTKE
jgi:hypothetical protein